MEKINSYRLCTNDAPIVTSMMCNISGITQQRYGEGTAEITAVIIRKTESFAERSFPSPQLQIPTLPTILFYQ